ncbi:MAG: cardiolipin synthase [Ruminococcus sp.]
MEEKTKATEKRLSVERGKQGIVKVIFGRTTILIALLLIQLLVLFGLFSVLEQYINIIYIYVIYQIFMAFLVLYIINQSVNPAFKLAWILPVLILPVFGALFYVFVKLQPLSSMLNRRLLKLEEETRKFVEQEDQVMERLVQEHPRAAGLASYLLGREYYPVYVNTTVKYFPLGEDKFEELKVQLKKAKHFIFLEYFIIQEGEMWNTVLEILKEKVQEGVEVRLMYDGTNTLSKLPPSYPKQMKELGIQCKVFAPIRPFLSTSQNNRDHRKILVIDGNTAFTGGINLADEYINKVVRFGHWKDTGIMLQGDAVKSFTLMFLRMWDIDKKTEDYARYLEVPVYMPARWASGYVIPYADSPLDNEQVGEQVYLNLLYTAKEYVHIMTPYLILDQEMTVALQFAAKRGVDVKIIMPHIPDKWYAFALAKTYYPELIKAGVRIYEYTPGFVHAKSFVVDDEQAVVGTINLDFRSLYLHFECAAYLCQVPCIQDIEKDFQDTLEKCQKITLDDVKRENLLMKAAGRMLRLVAPLM